MTQRSVLKTRVLTCVFLLASLASTASASDRNAAIDAVIGQHRSVVTRLIGNDFQSVANETLDRLVRDAIAALADNGHHTEAYAVQVEWETLYRGMAANLINTLGIGDHAPLSRWLSELTEMLHEKLGPMMFNALGLGDIDVINFGIPVVFQPNGDRRNGDRWDMREYRVHFVPFTGIAAQRAASAACRAILKDVPILPIFCGKLAVETRKLVEQRVAPRLSDAIYSQFTGVPAAPFDVDLGAVEYELRTNLEAVQP